MEYERFRKRMGVLMETLSYNRESHSGNSKPILKADTPTSQHMHPGIEFHQPKISWGATDRAFGYVFASFFALIAIWPLLHSAGLRWWALSLSLTFLLVAMTVPWILAPLSRIWLKIGFLLNKVSNPLIMCILFFTLFTPLSIVMRLFGRDLLSTKYQPDLKTYWKNRLPPGPMPESLKNQF